MAKIATNFYENIIDGDSPVWEKARQRPETQIQCLAAIVVLLAELVDSVNKAIENDESAQKSAAVQEIYKGADIPKQQ